MLELLRLGVRPLLWFAPGFLLWFGLPIASAQSVQVQWLLNFEQASTGALGSTYVPDAGVGEVAPNGGEIRIVNNSGRPAIETLPNGRRGLRLDGRGAKDDGLLFEHWLEGHPSRILEAVVAPDPDAPPERQTLIGSNDWDMRPPGRIVALEIDEFGLPTVELRSLDAYDHYPVTEELDSMHWYVKGTRPLAGGGAPVHLGMVYDHARQALYLYRDGQLVRDARLDGDEGEFSIYRAVGISNWALIGEPVRGFTGHIDAVAESIFSGEFRPSMFQLIEAEGPAPDPPAPSPRISLTLPDSWETSSRLPGERHPVFAPMSWDEPTYHHGPILTFWKERLYVAWHSAPRGENTWPPTGLVCSSTQLDDWSQPTKFPVVPRYLHATPDALYLWGGEGRIFETRDGEHWEEIGPDRMAQYRRDNPVDIFAGTSHLPFQKKNPRQTYLSAGVREAGAGDPFIALSDGRLMAAMLQETSHHEANSKAQWVCAPTTLDPSGLTGWSGGGIDLSACPAPGPAAGWQGPDGTLHYVSRFGPRLWHAASADGGQTWSPLTIQPEFTDSPSRKVFGMLPNGQVYYLGNPIPNSRAQLVLALSDDGWHFDRARVVRWEPVAPQFPSPRKNYQPGYEHVSAVVHDGKLYAVYSICRERIELSVVDLNDLNGGSKP